FRDGRLTNLWPEPGPGDDARLEPDPTSREQMAAWRDTHRIALGPGGRATRTFTVRLPHREKPGPVEFTAYAFNEDRVKSKTPAPRRPVGAGPAAPKAPRLPGRDGRQRLRGPRLGPEIRSRRRSARRRRLGRGDDEGGPVRGRPDPANQRACCRRHAGL